MLPEHSARSGVWTIALALLPLAPAIAWSAPPSFFNFESGQTRPLAMSPDGTQLLALNTPGGYLAIFDVDAAGLSFAAEVFVGLEPVALAARDNATTGRTEVWVVNLLSDSVSIVELDPIDVAASRVVRTLWVGDEPRDIVFAGSDGNRAFITSARRGQNVPASVPPLLTEGGIPRALVWVFDADAPGSSAGGDAIEILELFGDSPRALAASPDGSTVYASVFHSGNRTSSVRANPVWENGGPPPLPPGSPYEYSSDFVIEPGEPPVQSLIVRYDPSTGEWNDELDRDWSPHLSFTLPDFDVFAIDADADPPQAAAGLGPWSDVGTTLFNLAVRPTTGSVYVSNTDARNAVRFEPIEADGVQGHITESRISVLTLAGTAAVHANPHVDYSVETGPASERDESIALPTDLVFSGDGSLLYVAALGSGKVAVFDATALESGTSARDLVEVGVGPVGLALDETYDRLYVLNRGDHTISIVSDASNPLLRAETTVVPIGHDPRPAEVRAGQRFLYDAVDTSGHGDAACASCHIFGDLDALSWDLGDPFGTVIDNPNESVDNPNFQAANDPVFHPVKGPMSTQSLRGMAEAGAMHWRGDRTGGNDPGGSPTDAAQAFAKFNAAFVDLLGRPSQLTGAEMDAFTEFILTVRYPPNPVRALDGAMNADETAGLDHFLTIDSTLGSACGDCHALPLTTSLRSAREITDTFKVAHLRNLYQKVGRFGEDLFGNPPDPDFEGEQVRGFGFSHDGATSSLLDFVEGFTLTKTEAAQVTDFILSLDTGLHPAVGQQLTLAPGAADPDALARRDLLIARAIAGDCDTSVRVLRDGTRRSGLVISPTAIWLDGSSETPLDIAELTAAAGVAGNELTLTCLPPGSGKRVAMDRDLDGVMNDDERADGSDPQDAASVPLDCVGGVIDGIDKAQLKLKKNRAPAGDESLTIKGAWQTVAGSGPIDPLADGINFLVRDAAGTILLHRRVAAGAPADSFSPGWKVNGSGTSWKYTAKTGVLPGGVTKVSVRAKPDGSVKLVAKGKGGDFRVTTNDLTLEITLGRSADAAAGACATRTFSPVAGLGPACVFGTDQKSLKCR